MVLFFIKVVANLIVVIGFLLSLALFFQKKEKKWRRAQNHFVSRPRMSPSRRLASRLVPRRK